jgi:hypothetical protein
MKFFLLQAFAFLLGIFLKAGTVWGALYLFEEWRVDFMTAFLLASVISFLTFGLSETDKIILDQRGALGEENGGQWLFMTLFPIVVASAAVLAAAAAVSFVWGQ